MLKSKTKGLFEKIALTFSGFSSALFGFKEWFPANVKAPMTYKYETTDKIEEWNNDIKTIKVSFLDFSVKGAKNHLEIQQMQKTSADVIVFLQRTSQSSSTQM